MRLLLIVTILSSWSDVYAFAPERLTPRHKPTTTTALFHHHNNNHPIKKQHPAAAWGTSLLVGATIMAFSVMPRNPIVQAVPPANAVELSSGAFSVQAYTGGGGVETLKTTGLDSTALFKTLLKNRRELGASIGRLQNALTDELNSPVWTEIKKEVLQIEGDIVSDVKISAPSDWTQTFKDLSQGKLNFILNGEIVNVAVDSSIGKDEDKIVIKIDGVKVGYVDLLSNIEY